MQAMAMDTWDRSPHLHSCPRTTIIMVLSFHPLHRDMGPMGIPRTMTHIRHSTMHRHHPRRMVVIAGMVCLCTIRV